MWHVPDYRALGLFEYAALLVIGIVYWFAFRHRDARSGFELLVAGWLLVYFGIAYGIIRSFIMGVELNDSDIMAVGMIENLNDVVSGAALPLLLGCPLALKLMCTGERQTHVVRRLYLSALFFGFLDMLILFSFAMRVPLTTFM